MNNADSGNGSLRAAIDLADLTTEADVIEFGAFFDTQRTIALTSPIDISNPLTITGRGSGLLTIDAQGNSQIFSVAASLSISGLTLRGGRALTADQKGEGGAINLASGTHNITNIVFVDNHADRGGAVSAASFTTLTVSGCTFQDNYATLWGGGLFAQVHDGTTLDIGHSQFIENSAGIENYHARGGGLAIFNGRNLSGTPYGLLGHSNVHDSVFASNMTGGRGGGIAADIGEAVDQDTEIIFERNLITGNKADASGGGMYLETRLDDPAMHEASLMIRDSTVSNNECYGYAYPRDFPDNELLNIHGGGGIALYSDFNETGLAVSFVNLTISDNRAETGGGLLLDGPASVEHCTIVHNEAGLYADQPPGYDEELTGGGGVLIVDAQPYTHPDHGPARPLPTFSHTILARNSHDDSPNIGVHYAGGFDEDELPIHGGWPEQITAFIAAGDTGTLADVCLLHPPEGVELLVEPHHYYIYLEFDHCIIDNRLGPLERCPDPDDETGRLMSYSADSTVIEIPLYAGPEIDDPLIEPLAANGAQGLVGGFSLLTHALVNNPANEAIDAAPLLPGSPMYDQRGEPFLRQVDWPGAGGETGAVDIGAFELQLVMSPTDDADFDNDNDVDGYDFLVWQRGLGATGQTNKFNGDANGDGVVDHVDLMIWQQQFGESLPSVLEADFDGDDDVDADDFEIWQTNFGQSDNVDFEDGDADGNGVVDGHDFLVWQRTLSINTSVLEWIANTSVFDQLAPGVIVVSTLRDEDDGDYSLGDLSLSEAIHIASQTSGTDEIIFADEIRGAIVLTSELAINSSVTITGPGAGLLTIDASGGDASAAAGDGIRAFNVASGSTVTISGLSITGGDASGNGGGVYNAGALTLKEVEVQGNYAGSYGGGVFLDLTGTLTVDASTIDDNEAGVSGGGVLALVKDGTSLVVKNSTVSNNTSQYTGGLHIQGAAYSTTGRSWITNSTFSGNSALSAGGIGVQNSSNTKTDTLIVNCTITENHATGSAPQGVAGGVYNINVPNTHDPNTGVTNAVTLHNTILAGNTSANTAYDEGYGNLGGSSAYYSHHNVIGWTYAGLGIADGTNGNLVGTTVYRDPKLGPLAENGGPTMTHLPLHDSPALDAANTLLALGFGTSDKDQRSRLRNGPEDIGAVERGLVVSNPQDDNNGNYAHGNLSLREALALAAASGQKQEITFDPSVWGTLSLTATHLPINSNVDILGPGAGLLTIQAYDPTASQNNSDGARVFRVAAGATAAIHGLTITGGDVGGGGGGIYNFGHLTLSGVTVSDNATNSDGGGVYVNSGGSLRAINSTFDNNVSGGSGGGVGGQFGTGETLIIEGSTFSNNTAVAGGGFNLFSVSGSTAARIYNSTFSGNTATFSGGGVRVQDAPSSKTDLLIVNSTITLNRAMGAAPSGVAGGIYNVNLSNSDSGGVIDAITLRNTIVAKNTSEYTVFDDGWGNLNGVASQRSANNLIGLTYSNVGVTNGVERNIVGVTTAIEPLLGALADNGGATKTHALLEGSPAIDAGRNDYVDKYELSFDQRGETRVRDGNLDGLFVADIGTYEVEADEFFASVGA